MKESNRTRTFKRLLAFLLTVLVAPALAADGDPDLTFGIDGRVTADFANPFDAATALAIQSDGKIVVAGSLDGNFLVARFNSDGSPDPTFGTGGKVTTDFSGKDSSSRGGDPTGDYASALAIQADGMIVVSGRAGKVGSMTSLFALARYNSDGSLDTSFGNGGKVTTDFSGYRDEANALAIQSDGKIVAAGHSEPYGLLGAYGSGFALARYDRDGSLDATFGVGGKIITVMGGVARALAIGPDNKILAVGGAFVNPSSKFDELAECLQSWSTNDMDFVLVRLNTDGTPDTSFGSGGIAITAFSELHDTAVAVRIQSDGKLIVAGHTSDEKLTVPCDVDSHYNSRFALARYNSNGSLDASFGTGGLVTTTFSGSKYEYASALAIQSDGKLVVAGDARIFDPDHPNDYGRTDAIFRYNRDGSLDPSFGSGGKLTPAFSAGALAFQSDGKIVASGWELLPRQGNFIRYNFVLARYRNDSAPSLHPDTVQPGDPFTFKFPGPLRDTTYLDIRFRGPGSATDQVVLNWQHGISAEHIVPSDLATGAWLMTGVRTHEDPNDHNGDFIDVSLPLVVKVSPLVTK